MIILFLLILQTYEWSLNATLLNQSLIGFQINPAYNDSQLYLTVFGGVNKNTSTYSNSLYVYDYSNMNKYIVYNDGPSARAFSCSGVINDTVYFYGGYNGSHYFNQLWAFSLANSSWSQISVEIESTGRIQCGMVNQSDSLIIFGGKKQARNSTNLHYQVNLTSNTAFNMSFNSYYTVLENTLWDGTTQNYTSEGVFPNKTNSILPKNIWLSKISQSQSDTQISIVQANQTNSIIYILDTTSLLLKETIHLEIGIDSCEIFDVGLFCSQYLGEDESMVNFIFFRIEDWRKSSPTPEYIQFTQWPTGIYESMLFDIQKDLMAVVTTPNSVKLYRLPRNECETSNNTISCFYNKAYCTDIYQGAYCNREVCPGSLFFNEPYSFENFTFECGGNGKCIDGQCVCQQNYEGVSCSNHIRNPCGGTTTSNYPLSVCTCTNAIIGGNDCLTYFCYNDCSNVGICNNGVCQCQLPYSGHDCSILSIDIDFS